MLWCIFYFCPMPDSLQQLQNSVDTLVTRDSIVANIDTPHVAEHINFWHGHLLTPQHKEEQLLLHRTPDWIFPSMLIIIAVFAFLKVFYQKYFIQIIESFFNISVANQLVRDENILVQRASILLSFVFNLIIAMLLYYVSVQYHWTLMGIGEGLMRFLFFVCIVAGAYTLKFVLLKVSAVLFNTGREVNAYIFNIFLINNVLGIVLLPMVALMAFTQLVPHSTLLIMAIAAISAAYLYRLIRGAIIGIGAQQPSLFYIFLYFCALELAPLVVLIKVVGRQM